MSMLEDDGVSNGGSKRTSGRLGNPDEYPQEHRLSGRHSKPVQRLSPTDSRAIDFVDQAAPRLPQKTVQPLIDEDVIALIEADAPKPAPAPVLPAQPKQSQRPQPPVHVPRDDDTRYLIKKDADAVRDSRKMLKPAKPNDRSALAQGDTDKLPPVGKGAPPVGRPSSRPPSEAECEKDASGSHRIYLMKSPYDITPRPPILTLTHKVEAALAGKGRLETDVLSLRDGKTSISISVDVIEKHRCGVTVQHAAAKDVERLSLIYHAPRTSKRPGETGVENAFDSSQNGEHHAHKDHITNYAIPDAEANWAHVRKWVHRAADGGLLGRKGVSLVRTIEQFATLITHRTTLARYLGAVCELSRAELDARQATRLVLMQGLAWNEKQGAPEQLLVAQALLRDEYDVLIARWNATYFCAQQLAREYGLSLGGAKRASAPAQPAHAAGCPFDAASPSTRAEGAVL
jgi:hypothetical protein